MKRRIKQNKRNVAYMIIGRITTWLLLYAGIEIALYKAAIYILNNCITTL